MPCKESRHSDSRRSRTQLGPDAASSSEDELSKSLAHLYARLQDVVLSYAVAFLPFSLGPWVRRWPRFTVLPGPSATTETTVRYPLPGRPAFSRYTAQGPRLR